MQKIVNKITTLSWQEIPNMDCLDLYSSLLLLTLPVVVSFLLCSSSISQPPWRHWIAYHGRFLPESVAAAAAAVVVVVAAAAPVSAVCFALESSDCIARLLLLVLEVCFRAPDVPWVQKPSLHDRSPMWSTALCLSDAPSVATIVYSSSLKHWYEELISRTSYFSYL